MPRGNHPSAPDSSLTQREIYLPVLTGFHFGLIQVSSYFLFQCYYTATFMGYFFLGVAWIVGVWLNLRFGKPLTLRHSLYLSAVFYLLLALALVRGTPNGFFIPIYEFLILGIAAPAGALFRTRASTQPTAHLFFHENNGFVMGFVVSLLGFVHWGVRSPFILPVISFILILLIYRYGSLKYPLIVLGTGTILLLSQGLFDIAFMIGFFILILFFARKFTIPVVNQNQEISAPAISVSGKKMILFLSGFNLIILQFFITREFSTLLSASELSILIVATAYFTGYSIGYLVAPRIPEKLIPFLGWFILFLHLDIFLFLRYFAALLVYLGAGWWVLMGLLFITSLFTSAFYSLFLPRLTDNRTLHLKLTSTYSLELAGAVVGTIFLVIHTLSGARWIQPVYFFILLSILYLLQPRGRWKFTPLIGALGILPFLIFYGPKLNQTVIRDYYALRGYSNPTICYQTNSLYHTIEILDTHPQPGFPADGRWSFINGVLYFGYQTDTSGAFIQETGLSEFTYFLAELPARYQVISTGRKLNILILGCGSMYSIGRVGPYADKIQMVEIDPEIVRSAKACWSQLNQYDQWPNAQIIIDDAKHFIRTQDTVYDLIIMDISAPYTLGTLLLHNQDFFRILKDRLAPGGLFAESTQGRADPDYPESQGMKILAGVVNEYSETLVLNTYGSGHGNHGFVYSSQDDSIDWKRMDSLLIADNMRSGVRLETDWDTKVDWTTIRPFTYSNMETLLSGNIWRLTDRLELDRTFLDLDWLRRRWSRLATFHLQLPQELRQLFRSPWFWVWFASFGVTFIWSYGPFTSKRQS